jgi:uncharacterized Rmd1/YagE family protein
LADNFQAEQQFPEAELASLELAQPGVKHVGLFRFLRLFVVIIFLTVFLTMYLLQHAHVMSVSYKLTELENNLKNLRRENEKYQIELARHSGLSDIDREATEQLGLLRSNQIIFLKVAKFKNE